MMFVDPTWHCAISKKTTTLPIAACDAPINVDVSVYGNGLGGASTGLYWAVVSRFVLLGGQRFG
jgi:hypothetical protein